MILKKIGDADCEHQALQSMAADLKQRSEEAERERRLLEEQIRKLQTEGEELDRRDMEERDRMMQRSGEIRRLATAESSFWKKENHCWKIYGITARKRKNCPPGWKKKRRPENRCADSLML